jgi:ABC-type polysaccharide/polyol phosphate transport system ATPase subunit
MSSDIAIQVDKLSKCYQIYDTPRDRLLQMLARGRKQYFKEFWSLKDVSFTVKKGETVGVIGRNGAGKSTLLQLICGTLNPTSGNIYTSGRIAALLELGSGFNVDFTGRENVFMNGALLGLSKEEIEAKFDAIAAFADIGHFLEQPVKIYSSGMFARLAFSVAVHVDPSLLIVDEALSVGDMAFQEKSITRMKEIRESGTSILFVSHSLSAVRNFCDRAVWLENGKLRADGERLRICDDYQREVERELRRDQVAATAPQSRAVVPTVDGEKSISITSVRMERDSYRMADDIAIHIGLHFHRPPSVYGVGVIIYDMKGNVVSILNTLRDDIFVQEAKESWTLSIKDNHFAPGEYSITVSIPDEHAMFSFDKWEHCARFYIDMERSRRGLAKVDGMLRCDHEWN